MGGEDWMTELYVDGRSAWPVLAGDQKAFEEYCARVLAERDGGEVRRYAADLFLCCACASGDEAAMEAIESRYGRTVRAAVEHVVSDGEFADEIVQEFWERLFASGAGKVGSYSARGPLDAWLRVVATRLALDRCRARKRETLRRAELDEKLAAAWVDPSSRLTKERYGAILQDAVRAAITGLSPRERNVLRMHTIGRLGIDDIGRICGVHRATAARWLERMRERIRGSAREHFTRSCPELTSSEFTSVVRLLESEMDVSLSGWGEGRSAAVETASVSVH